LRPARFGKPTKKNMKFKPTQMISTQMSVYVPFRLKNATWGKSTGQSGLVFNGMSTTKGG